MVDFFFPNAEGLSKSLKLGLKGHLLTTAQWILWVTYKTVGKGNEA